MPGVSANLTVAAPVSAVYQYLRRRYEGSTFRNVSRIVRGYVPAVACVDEEENKRIEFSAAGRDSLFKFRISGWTWGYELSSAGEGQTQVNIWHRWSVFLSLISMFTARGQAANELVETAMALEALAIDPHAAADAD